MKPLALLAMIAGVATTSPTSYALSSTWSRYDTAYPIAFAALAHSRYVRVPLDESIDAGADGDYASLRVVTGDGTEVPFALDPDAVEAASSTDDARVPVLDFGFVRGAYTQAVLDFGTAGDLHEAVRVETSRPTYFERVSVESSDDRTTWRELRDDAIVYAVANDAIGRSDRGNQTIAFPPTRARWLRLRVLDGSNRFWIDAAYAATGTAHDTLVAVAAKPAYARNDHRQTWTYAFGDARLDVSAVTLVGSTTPYSRSVSVEAIGNEAGDVTQRQSLSSRDGGSPSMLFGRLVTRGVRVTIDNGNDAPVPHLHPQLLRRPHSLVFSADPNVRYALLASHDDGISAPVYDLGHTLATRDWTAERGTLGASFRNPAYRDSRPLTERFPWLVGVGFALAALVLGALAVSTLRTATRKSAAPESDPTLTSRPH